MFQKELSCKSRVLERKFRCSVDRFERIGGHGLSSRSGMERREGRSRTTSTGSGHTRDCVGSEAEGGASDPLPKEGIQEKQGRGQEDGMRLGLRWGAGMEKGLHPDPGRHETARRKCRRPELQTVPSPLKMLGYCFQSESM